MPSFPDDEADLDKLRDRVTAALDEQGHTTAAALLGAGRWKLDEDGAIQVEVGVKKTMLGLTMNGEAWKIVREALRGAGATQKMTVVPGEASGKPANASLVSRPTCFVIQPFDSGKFDKRYKETFAPAIIEAGFQPYRVDEDRRADVLITSIEEGIRSASVCLADITTDNPNVWYELGYAFAAKRPVIMVCATIERAGKLPFDIQHRVVTSYKTEAQSDFKALSDEIVERLRAVAEKSQILQQIAEAEPIAPVSGLSQVELTVLAVAAGAALPEYGFSVWSLKNDAEKLGLSAVGISLAIQRLRQKKFLEDAMVDSQDGEYKGARVTPKGWEWIDVNDDKFILRRAGKEKNYLSTEITDDDIQF